MNGNRRRLALCIVLAGLLCPPCGDDGGGEGSCSSQCSRLEDCAPETFRLEFDDSMSQCIEECEFWGDLLSDLLDEEC